MRPRLLECWEAELRRGGVLPAPLDVVAMLGSGLVRAGMWTRRIRRTHRVPAYVVSVGNITAGGTGKTPVVIDRVQQELRAGRTVAVLTRGYGMGSRGGHGGLSGGRSRDVVVVRAGSEGTADAHWLGDEPELIAWRAPGVIIARGADRVAGARAAIDRFGAEVLILDDGFQYLRLERDENIVVVDAANPFGNGRLLPRGILREPVPELSRATAVVVTRCDQAASLNPVRDALSRYCPDAPVRYTRHGPARLWSLADRQEVPLHTLTGARIGAACAIGRPEAYRATLESLGAEIAWFRAFPDHATIPVDELPSIGLTVVTEKDAMRITAPPPNWFALGVDLVDFPAARARGAG